MKSLRPIILVLLAAAGWAAASRVPARIEDNLRRRGGAAAATWSGGRSSPLLVFTTVGLGAFRGLLIDAMWSRVTDLQERGDYVEIAQLAGWITKLEPRLPAVWDYHAFNMAYNISSLFADPAERWRWVSAGIRLLRDEGLLYNPDQSLLYDRICRVYQHKLLEYSDSGRPYYRLALASEVQTAFGGPRPDRANGSGPESRATEALHLDPALMRDVERRYGPLDWRLPAAHVLYWATLGRAHAQARQTAAFDGLISEALIDNVADGAVVELDPAAGRLVTGPRLDAFPNTVALFHRMAEQYGVSLGSDAPFAGLYRYFLRKVWLVARGADAYRLLRDESRDVREGETEEAYRARVEREMAAMTGGAAVEPQATERHP